MRKQLPRLASDKEAERFVATSDLAEYDLSGMRMVRFEFQPKTERVNMRLPRPLLDAVRASAARRECRISASSARRSKTPCSHGRRRDGAAPAIGLISRVRFTSDGTQAAGGSPRASCARSSGAVCAPLSGCRKDDVLLARRPRLLALARESPLVELGCYPAWHCLPSARARRDTVPFSLP